MARRRQSLGFTLVELMATVAILAVLVLVTIPPVLKAVQRRQGINAAQAVLDLVEFAKVQAASRNLAHELSWTVTDGASNGILQVREGTTSACMGFSGPIVRTLDLGDQFPAVRLHEVLPASLAGSSLCVKPDGRILDAATQQPVASSDSTYAAGDARLVLRRYDGDREEGPRHVVVIPFNGASRITFEHL